MALFSNTSGGGVDDSFEAALTASTQGDVLDPSIEDGYSVKYDREVPLEIRSDNNASEDGVRGGGILESIKVKMLLQGRDDAPTSMRLELTSEADLFFSFMHEINDEAYRILQDDQKLMVSFSDYPNVLIRMLNSIIREPHVHLGVFTMTADANSAHLDFIQNMEYKFVELMTCSFERCPEEVVQRQITYRYNSMRQRLALTQTRLFEMNHLVKTKNPSLLLHLQKGSSEHTKSPTRESHSHSHSHSHSTSSISGGGNGSSVILTGNGGGRR
jgi:hypothetical protein